jgi:ADP-heptose:LPS heptosyltransferase
MIINFQELVTVLSCSNKSDRLEFPEITKSTRENIKQKLTRHSINSEKPIVLINPNVSDTSPTIDRSWSLENFIKVANYCQKKNLQVIFIGGPDQIERTDRAASQCGRGAVSIAGHINIQELIALMSKSFLLITNDSGPLHMAVSVNLPCFSFFGTESPVIYGHNHGLNKVFCANLACSPCLSVFNYKKGWCEFNSKCMQQILPEDVISYLESKLKELEKDFKQRIEQG